MASENTVIFIKHNIIATYFIENLINYIMFVEMMVYSFDVYSRTYVCFVSKICLS